MVGADRPPLTTGGIDGGSREDIRSGGQSRGGGTDGCRDMPGGGAGIQLIGEKEEDETESEHAGAEDSAHPGGRHMDRIRIRAAPARIDLGAFAVDRLALTVCLYACAQLAPAATGCGGALWNGRAALSDVLDPEQHTAARQGGEFIGVVTGHHPGFDHDRYPGGYQARELP